jgi:hypothetical protein
MPQETKPPTLANPQAIKRLKMTSGQWKVKSEKQRTEHLHALK